MVRGLLVIGASALALAGCTLSPAPQGTVITAEPGSDARPVDAPVAFVETAPRSGPTYNQLGGEIPRGAPSPRTQDLKIEEIGES